MQKSPMSPKTVMVDTGVTPFRKPDPEKVPKWLKP
jgi:hypothetical protein